jgi:hypothetical protein
MKDLIRSFEIERKTCGTLDKQGSDNMAWLVFYKYKSVVNVEDGFNK